MSRSSYVDLSHLHSELTSRIIRCAFTVHRKFGYGFLESVYRRATAVELRYQGIPVLQEVLYNLEHRDCDVGLYKADLIVESSVVVETKTGLHPDPVAPEQALNYLKASGLQVGLVLHFGPTLSIRRVCYSGREGEIPQTAPLQIPST